MNSFSSKKVTKLILTLTLSTYLVITLSICAPIDVKPQEKEHLLALPSNEYQQVYTRLRQDDDPSHTTQFVQYVSQDEPSQQPQIVTTKPVTNVHQPDNLVRQDGVYYLVKQTENEPVMVEIPNEGSINGNNNNEHLTMVTVPENPAHGPRVASNEREYPGEIIYVSQEEAQNGQPRYEQQLSLSNLAPLTSQDSSLPATILTEVPVKDLPDHVLERLKKDYGVKVVATRERPGANLVINCEDNTDQESSICSKQSAYLSALPKSAPYTFDGTLVEEHNQPELSNEQPRLLTNRRLNDEENKSDQSTSLNDGQAPNQEFGTRQSAYGNNAEANRNEQTQPEIENSQQDPPQAEREDPSHRELENHHHLGFEEQPGRKAA